VTAVFPKASSLPLLVDSSMTGFLVSGALLTCLREQNALRFVYNFHVVHPVKVRTFSKQWSHSNPLLFCQQNIILVLEVLPLQNWANPIVWAYEYGCQTAAKGASMVVSMPVITMNESLGETWIGSAEVVHAYTSMPTSQRHDRFSLDPYCH
jgi:hypothetical protein